MERNQINRNQFRNQFPAAGNLQSDVFSFDLGELNWLYLGFTNICGITNLDVFVMEAYLTQRAIHLLRYYLNCNLSGVLFKSLNDL